MNKILMEMKEKRFSAPPEEQYIVLQPPPPPPSSLQTSGFNLNNKVSPSVLLIIIVLAIIFFVSGLLHLLVRYLLRPPTRDADEMDTVTALQGQLQQLFHLHDAGVDQSFIDTLPIFNYKAIIGVKSPFDCAVCLSEFEAEDNLRLLPKCSHAFHMQCIDTWLLSHSTCPLCRASLIPDFSSNHHSSAIVLVLESGSETSREIVPDLGTNNNSVARVSSQRSDRPNDESKLPNSGILQKSSEIQAREEEEDDDDNSGGKVVTVKLGKFRNVDGGSEGSSSSTNVDSRRCFSMGSFAYIMDENSTLKVPIRTPIKKQSSKKPSLPLIPGHRPAMSECGCDSRREFIGFETFRNVDIQGNGKAINRDSSRGESVSISKIWLRGKKDKANLASEQSSRRAFSFRFPGQRNVIAEGDLKANNNNNKNCGRRRAISEIDIGGWENGRSEIGCDDETQSCNSLDSMSAKTPSFARRTLLWLLGRPNKVVHSQFSSNV